MSTVLVTGATGLLGANLVRELVRRGDRVRIFVRATSDQQALTDLPDLERAIGDVTDAGSARAACDGIDVVYHCAAVVSLWDRRMAEMQRVNVDGTRNVLAAVRDAGVRRLVYCSSMNAIGVPERPGDPPSTEDTEWNLARAGVDNAYGRTKRAAQELVRQATDVDGVIVNPAFLFGPYDVRPSSGRLILAIASRRIFFFPTGSANFADARDVASAMVAAADRGERGRCYLLGGRNASYRTVFADVADAVGVRRPWLALPRPIARIAGRLGDAAGRLTGREPIITSAVIRFGYARHDIDTARAERELGLRRTPLRVAIDDAVQWFRATGRLAPSA